MARASGERIGRTTKIGSPCLTDEPGSGNCDPGGASTTPLFPAGADLTREGLLKAIKETGKFDIGGLPMTFSAEKNEGLDKVFMTIIEADGTFKPVEKLAKVSAN